MVDVYEEFVNVFVYKQIWNFVDNSVGSILKVYGRKDSFWENNFLRNKIKLKLSTATYGFIGAVVVTFICVYLFNNYVKLTIVSLFKYILAPFLSNQPTNSFANSHRNDYIGDSGDRISGENLTKILDIASRVQVNQGLNRGISSSGVQDIDVLDGIEGKKNEKGKVVEPESDHMSTSKVSPIEDGSRSSDLICEGEEIVNFSDTVKL